MKKYGFQSSARKSAHC